MVLRHSCSVPRGVQYLSAKVLVHLLMTLHFLVLQVKLHLVLSGELMSCKRSDPHFLEIRVYACWNPKYATANGYSHIITLTCCGTGGEVPWNPVS